MTFIAPKNLTEAVQWMTDAISPEDQAFFLKGDTYVRDPKDSKHENLIKGMEYPWAMQALGRWIRNSLELWKEDNELQKWFIANKRIGHPDDISFFIEKAWFAQMKGESFDETPFIEAIHEHWAEQGYDFLGQPLWKEVK